MNEEAKKTVLRKMSYGMWVLTAGNGDDLEGSSVTWVMQTSFNPPLVVAAVKDDSTLWHCAEWAPSTASLADISGCEKSARCQILFGLSS